MSFVDEFKTCVGAITVINSGAIVGLMAFLNSLNKRVGDTEDKLKKIGDQIEGLQRSFDAVDIRRKKSDRISEGAVESVERIEKNVEELVESTESSKSEITDRLDDIMQILEENDLTESVKKKRKKPLIKSNLNKRQNKLPLPDDDIGSIVEEIMEE